MKINKFDFDVEGLPDMLFTAQYMNTIYDCCNKDCTNCTLGKTILNNSTNVCLIITQTKLKLAKEIRDMLYQ